MANANKKIISQGKAAQDEKKPSRSPVTVEVVDGVFVFHGGKGGHNITERKNKALEPYGKCIYNYGLLLELIPGDQTSRINQNIGNSRYVHNNYLAERIKYYDEHRETLSIDQYKKEFLPKLKEEWQKRKSEEGKNEQLAKVDLSKVHATDGVVVEGFDNTPIKFAKCCSPLPGDPIVGFITRGFGVSIHKQSCVNAISSMKDPTNAPRWVKAYWADSVKDSYKAGLEIIALNRNELLSDVLAALADIRVPIYAMNARQVENNCAVISLTIGINNTEHLNRVVARLSKVKDVLKVTRS